MGIDPWQAQREALGAVIRNQRQLAQLSLRQMADLAKVSNPYLSQLERGLHEPSRRVLQGIADALGVPVDAILAQAGLAPEAQPAPPSAAPTPSSGTSPRAGSPAEAAADTTPPASAEAAIRADPLLSEDQKDALLSVYRSYTAAARPPAPPPA